jgi:hypothetical protein
MDIGCAKQSIRATEFSASMPASLRLLDFVAFFGALDHASNASLLFCNILNSPGGLIQETEGLRDLAVGIVQI